MADTITNPRQLKDVNNDDLCERFCANLDAIYLYGIEDIEASIVEKPVDILLKLRSQLFLTAQEKIEDLKHKTLLNRKVSHTAANDVVHLGYSIVNGNPSKELDKFCVVKSARNDPVDNMSSEEDPIESLADAIKAFAILNKTVNTLRSTVSQLSTENDALKRRVSDLEKNCVSLSDDSGTDLEDEDSDSERLTENHISRPENVTLTATNVSAPPQNGAQTQTVSQSVNPAPAQPSTSSSSPPRVNNASETQALSTNQTSSADTNTFSQQRHQRRREKRKSRPTPPGLRAATQARKSKQVYIGLVAPDCSPKDVSNHLSSNGVKVADTDVQLLSRNGETKSFCVSIPEDRYDAVLAADSKLLPSGLKVRPFYPKKTKPKGPLPSARRGQPSARRGQLRPASSRPPYRKPEFRSQSRHYDPEPCHSWDDYSDYYHGPEYNREWPKITSTHTPYARSPRVHDHEQYGAWYY